MLQEVKIPDRYNIQNFKRGLSNPKIFYREAGTLLNRLLHKTVMRVLFKYRYGSGVQVTEKDWDNLIILDACRFSEFKSHSKIDGELRSVVSKGSTSREWMKKNFDGKQFPDTVYVGGNPHMERFSDEFYYVKKSYSQTSNGDITAKKSIPGWDPEEVYRIATDAFVEYPNKKVIVHFMQPHDPYLGVKADELRQDVSQSEDVDFEKYSYFEKTETNESANKLWDLREAAKEGYISREQLREVYIENLEIVLEYVEDLISEINGKTVITSDHGELLGEGRLPKHYGHPIGIYRPELRIVPWLEVTGERREIIPEDPIGTESASDETVEEHLEALGYK